MQFTRRNFLASASTAALSACSVSPTAMPFVQLAQASQTERLELLVVTNRAQLSEEKPDQIFSEGRTPELKFKQYSISIPTDRGIGDFSYPNRNPNPEKNFFVAGQSDVSDAQTMLGLLRQRALKLPRGKQGIFAVVHGFNVTYPGALFRAAQISKDFGIEQPTALFSWPSGGSLRDYAYDRDSVLYSRDDAVLALKALARSIKRPINILAHSMGCFLTMEAIKQLAVEGDQETLKYITGIFLMHADLDVDVFRRQMSLIDEKFKTIRFLPGPNGKPIKPTFIIAFTDTDRVLNVSSFVSGWKDRVGNIANKDAIEDILALDNVHAFNLTDVEDQSQLRHVTFRASDALKNFVEKQQQIELIVDGTVSSGQSDGEEEDEAEKDVADLDQAGGASAGDGEDIVLADAVAAAKN